ncbi:MAG: alpha/beta hydrolase [Planctomycetota bacterium]|jgi:pimeloyl-ACP methyl ester carboxylesterase
MKRTLSTVPLALAMLSVAGCPRDFYARKIVEQDTNYGKLMLELAGKPDSLIGRGRIDFHHRIATGDETEIDVWVIDADPPAGVADPKKFKPYGTVVLRHGLGDSKASFLSLGERLAKMGYDVVLPDLRAHGASEGKYVTWGAKERKDVKHVMDTLTASGGVSDQIYAFGSSLGAAVAIQYAAIDPRVKGVMAMAPFKDITIVRRSLMLLAPVTSDKKFNGILAAAGKMADFDPAEADTLAAAAKLKCPILLVHGLLDMAIPVENSKAIHEAAGEPKQLIVVPWASHTTLLLASERWIAGQIDNIARTGLEEPIEEPKQD